MTGHCNQMEQLFSRVKRLHGSSKKRHRSVCSDSDPAKVSKDVGMRVGHNGLFIAWEFRMISESLKSYQLIWKSVKIHFAALLSKTHKSGQPITVGRCQLVISFC